MERTVQTPKQFSVYFKELCSVSVSSKTEVNFVCINKAEGIGGKLYARLSYPPKGDHKRCQCRGPTGPHTPDASTHV